MHVNSVEMSGDEAFYVKGHVDLFEFLEELEEQHGRTLDEFYSKPEHMYARNVPDNTGNYAYYVHFRETGGRGAYPVTVMMP